MGGAGSSILVVEFSLISGNAANGGPMAGAGGISNGGTATITASVVRATPPRARRAAGSLTTA